MMRRVHLLTAALLCGVLAAPAGAAQATRGVSSVRDTGGAEPARTVCVQDVSRGTPVSGARVAIRLRGTAANSASWRTLVVTNDEGCTRIPDAVQPVDGVRIARLGFARSEQRIDPASRASILVEVAPVATLLASRAIVADRGTAPAGGSSATVRVADARRFGVGSTGGLLTLLPFVQPRSARGELSVSLRGARREQVVVTLDGIPLNDPATGLADVADVPLAALASVRVDPGSDALGAGPGAVGGVVALQSGQGTVASLRSGAFGERSVEGAWSGAAAGTDLRIGASASSAQNDFPYLVPTGKASGDASRDASRDGSRDASRDVARRINNDITRQSLFLSARGERSQLTAIASRSEQGMVGAVNVRDYDADRSRSTRLFTRATMQAGGTLVGAAVRALTLDYQDPRRPVFNNSARTVSADADARRTVGRALVVAGVGVDRLRTSSAVRQDQNRGFVAVTHRASLPSIALTTGARVDAISGAGVLPSFSLNAEYQWATLATGIRVAQALRAPTLYDLYFGSPQRLNVAALDPERVRHDAELYARWASLGAGGVARRAQLSLISRETRDAIVWFPGNFGWSPNNVGVERANGMEASLGVSGTRAVLRTWGTVYHTMLRSGALTIPTPYVPVYAAGANGSLAWGPLQFGTVARWLGERPFTVGPRDPRFNLPAVLLLDTSLSTTRTLSRDTELLVALAVNNVTNQRWQSVRGFPAPTRAWSLSLSFLPAHSR